MCGIDRSYVKRAGKKEGGGNMPLSQMLMKKHLCGRTEGSSCRNLVVKRIEGNATTVPGHYDSV